MGTISDKAKEESKKELAKSLEDYVARTIPEGEIPIDLEGNPILPTLKEELSSLANFLKDE